MKYGFCFVLFAVVLSGCGRGGSAVVPASTVPLAVATAAPTAAADPQTVPLEVHQHSTATSGRKPAYIAKTTQSVAAIVNAAPPIVFNFTPSSPNCSTASGTLVCSIPLRLPLGAITLTINAYDGLNGTGTLLSTGSLSTTIVPHQRTPIKVTLDGVVAAVALAIDNPAPPAGTAATLHLAVSALDGDGNTIVGPGVYADANGNPLTITLTDSDTSGATSLAATTVAGPGAPIALAYTGAALATATFGATVPGLAPSAVTNSVLTPIPQTNGPALTVDAASARHAISPDIYGITWFYNTSTDAQFAAFAKEIRLPANRHGGDGTSRYNWQVDSSNAGQDWFFTAGNGQAHGTAVPSASVDKMVVANAVSGTKQILTIPTIEWINNDSPWHCGFPKELYPPQQAYNPYVPYGGGECGNGYATDGTQLLGSTPTVSDIKNDPTIQAAWVNHLVSRFGNAANHGVAVYEMDNEPTGWQYMHRDIHPNGVTCDEIVTQDEAYALAVKGADPTAAVLAPDDLPVADVFGCHGTTNGLYFLQQMANYSQSHGARMLDYYSAHYPSCCGGDPIANTVNHIHLHQGWIAQAYPGTKLAYDEWNVGGPTDVPTALLHADSLGVFGREGVDLASFWGFNAPTDPTAYVYRMFRNYDAAGSRFGDTSVSATTADATKLTVYAAQRTSDGAMTVLVVNKGTSVLTSALSLANHPATVAHVYQYAAAAPGTIAHPADLPVLGSTIVGTFPAQSVTLLAVP